MNPNLLKENPINVRIYGKTTPSDDLVQSVKANGVLEAIVIKSDNVIVSGHRRWQAAVACGLDDVPVRVVSFDDELAEREALIEYNRQREKTFSQKMNEADELRAVYEERGKQNQGTRTDLLSNLTKSKAVNTRHELATRNDWSIGTQHTADKLWQAAKDGDEVAQELVEKIDNKEATISGAYKEITQIKKKKKQQAREDSIAESVKTSTAPAVIWQAILYYKGVEAPPPNTDSLVELFSVQYINAPDGRQGDRYHPWQKPLEIADRFISHSAQPGDTVLSSGCDISDENIEIARGSYLIY